MKISLGALLCGAFLSISVAASGQLPRSERIYISGTGIDDTRQWDFLCSDGQNSGTWSKIAVPGSWETQGFGDYTYGRYYTVKDAQLSMETGTYRTAFATPAHAAGDRVTLWLDGVMTDCEVTVNGKNAGTHQGGFYRFGLDVTDLLNDGSELNSLEIKVFKHSGNKSINAAERKADWWLFGGIYRPVWLEVTPKGGFAKQLVDARGDGTLAIDLAFNNVLPASKLVVGLDGELADTVPVSADASGRMAYRHRYEGVELWTPESPTLHNLTLTVVDGDGHPVMSRDSRVGFRTVEFFPQDGLYLNGTRLVLKGVNRHSFSTDGGRATSAAMSREDARLIKEMNMNAVRSHYPPDEHFLDACDSLGLLYIDELAGWHDAYDTETGRRLVAEMIERDVNHPCIVLWSNGNEGGWNKKLDPLFAVHDSLQRRHVIHPWADFNDLDTHHYPAYLTGVGRFTNGHKVFMPTEFMHAMYDQGGGAGLRDFWDRWLSNPLFAGGFIWAFCDEAPARSDRGGALDSDGSNAPDGLVGPRREREGSFYAVKAQWSPVRLKPVAVNRHFDGTLKVANEYLYTDLKDCTMVWRTLRAGTPAEGADTVAVVAQGVATVPSITPGETGTVTLQGIGCVTDADILELTATDPHGMEINTWCLPVGKVSDYYTRHTHNRPAAKPAKKKKVQPKATIVGSEATLEGAGTKVTFSTVDGTIKSLTRNGKAVPLTNGPRAVGMKMVCLPEKSEVRLDADGRPTFTARYRGGVDSIVWRINGDGSLDMDALMLNRSGGGGGFDDAFMDTEVYNLGLTFNYPDSVVTGMKWLGRGPYRVWKNRMAGAEHSLWHKDFNNTVTGESYDNLVYPEFKGYHGDMYWATLESATALPLTVYSRTDGIHYHIFTPAEPKGAEKPTMPAFPDGDLSFLLDIPAIASFKPIEQQGPNSQPGNIRIKRGDEGLHINLTFDFTTAK